MKRPMILATVLGLLAAAATVVALVVAARGSFAHSCHVCVTFHGRTACREAVGPTREEATRTAVDNACAFLAAGMTETVACTTATPPDEITCSP